VRPGRNLSVDGFGVVSILIIIADPMWAIGGPGSSGHYIRGLAGFEFSLVFSGS
jgi:hypothetical protein